MSVVTHEEVGGLRVPIEVDTNGTFSARIQDDGAAPIVGKTLAEVRDKVRAAVKKLQAKKEVEVTVLGGKFDGFSVTRGDRDSVFDAILRGVAERTDRILFTIGGKKVQSESYARGFNVARRLKPVEITQYKALVKSAIAAEADLQAFINSVKIDPEKATEVGTDGK
jgi:hypothetical protein